MDTAKDALEMLFHVIGGLGLFFSGVGILWFTTTYQRRSDNSASR